MIPVHSATVLLSPQYDIGKLLIVSLCHDFPTVLMLTSKLLRHAKGFPLPEGSGPVSEFKVMVAKFMAQC